MRHITLEPNEVVIVALVVFEKSVHGVDQIAIMLIFLYFLLLVLLIPCFLALMHMRRM